MSTGTSIGRRLIAPAMAAVTAPAMAAVIVPAMVAVIVPAEAVIAAAGTAAAIEAAGGIAGVAVAIAERIQLNSAQWAVVLIVAPSARPL
jgi:hypothetical protein